MWLETYRLYDLRYRGSSDILLERRAEPRFESLLPLRRFTASPSLELEVPSTPGLLFFTMDCGLSWEGRLRSWLYRIPRVTISVRGSQGTEREARVLPAVLVSPVLINRLPGTLAEFATLFEIDGRLADPIHSFRLGGPGLGSYSNRCAVEWLTPAPSGETSTAGPTQPSAASADRMPRL
jgi:hypothetical protein